MPIKIKLMADYGCYPLWWEEEETVGNIDPETLPLCQKTIDRLDKWSARFDARMNFNDPYDSPDISPVELADFEKEGISLWKQLKHELEPYYQVFYFSDRLHELIYNLEDLENERSLPVTESVSQLVMR